MRIAIRPLIALCSVLAVAFADADVWQPSPGHEQIAIWPNDPPDAQPAPGPENFERGSEYCSVDNVSRPTVTVYPARGINTGVALVVFPGGGYRELAIDLQGTEICDWLSSRGITGVLLKYRVPDSGPHPYPPDNKERDPKVPMALQDAQRALGLIRFHAREWHIDPQKIGVIGFSAGGHLVADLSTHFAKRSYRSIDEADKASCRPDFAVALYPGHLCNWPGRPGRPCSDDTFDLNPRINVTKQTPPTFLVQAENDYVDNVNQALVYYIALKNAAVPVEMHLYAEGGHAFGLRSSKFPISAWPQLMETWLKTIQMISK